MEDVSKTYAKFINNITLHLINGTINENEFNISLPFTNQFILKWNVTCKILQKI